MRGPDWRQGWTPLHLAAQSTQVGAVQALLDANADPHATDVSKRERVGLWLGWVDAQWVRYCCEAFRQDTLHP